MSHGPFEPAKDWESRAPAESPMITGTDRASVPALCPDMPATTATATPADSPSVELPTSGPDHGDRDARGRFVPGNIAALRSGDRSTRSGAELYPERASLLAERQAAIVADLGGHGQVTATRAELVSKFCQVSAIADSLADDIAQRGALTSKGRCRASVSLFLQVCDRIHKLATAIGLERRARPVPTIHDYLEQRSAQTDAAGQAAV